MKKAHLWGAPVIIIFHLFCISTLVDAAQFLTLPFNDPGVKIQQGWIYTWGAPHNGIDYIKGELDQSSTWQSFEVVAAYDGVAIATSGGGYGTFVYIRHDQTDSSGLNYFTLYSHLETYSEEIPFVDYGTFRKLVRKDDLSQWIPVGKGEPIGTSGDTGTRSGWIHLHFEVQRGGYPLNKTDPYDIYSTREYYPECSPDYLWTECPPIVSNGGNLPPTITSLTADPNPVSVNGQSTISVSASDPENDLLTYTWSATGGSLSSTTSPGPVTWTAPSTTGFYTVTVNVTDNQAGHSPVSQSVIITVEQPAALPLQVTSISPTEVVASTFNLTINGSNFDGGAVDQIYWAADGHFVGQGTVLSRSSTQLVVQEFMTGAPIGTYIVKVKNSDGQLSNGVKLHNILFQTYLCRSSWLRDISAIK